MRMWLRLSNRLWNSDKIINMTPVYGLNTINTQPSALRSNDRHDNVVITTTSVMKCIFLNFGAILKRMVKLAKDNSEN